MIDTTDGLIPLAICAVMAIGGAAILWWGRIGGHRRGIWASLWLGLCVVGLLRTPSFEYFILLIVGIAAAFAGGWGIGRFVRNRPVRFLVTIIWALLPIIAFCAIFLPPRPGTEMFGFGLVLFAPIFLAWIVATLLGTVESRARLARRA